MKFEQIMQSLITGGPRSLLTNGSFNNPSILDDNNAPVVLTNQDMQRFNIELESVFNSILEQVEAG